MTEGRGPDPAAVYLRMDDFPARLVIVPGEQDRLLATGWEVADERTLAAVARVLAAGGLPVKAGDGSELADRRVGQLLHVDDPSGNSLEIFCGAALDSRPAVSPYGNVFVTGDQGLGHVVLPATDDEETLAFYTDAARLPAPRLDAPAGRVLRPTGRRPAGVDALPRLLPAASLAGAGADEPGGRASCT